MILTHILALLVAPPVAVSPWVGQLPIGDGGTRITGPGRALALMPALPVRAPPVLAVRGD
jgi:hypothetical protein